jgi:hypothetical protein
MHTHAGTEHGEPNPSDRTSRWVDNDRAGARGLYPIFGPNPWRCR